MRTYKPFSLFSERKYILEYSSFFSFCHLVLFSVGFLSGEKIKRCFLCWCTVPLTKEKGKRQKMEYTQG